MNRMEIDLSGQAIILQEGVEDEEDVLVGNPPIRTKKSEQKKRGDQSGKDGKKALRPAQRGEAA
ncbi:MAG: hypothetical protein WBL48_19195 [Pseudolabrys sp.]